MFNRLLSTYGFDSLPQFAASICPSSKYGLSDLSLMCSIVFGVLARYLGLTPLIVVVMTMAIFAEMWTGIKASSKQGKDFESFRFSRGILKLCVWCLIFFIFNSFALEMRNFNGWPYVVASYMFQILHASSMVFFVIENGTSILENQAILDGKPKTQYVEAVKTFWLTFVNALKGRFK